MQQEQVPNRMKIIGIALIATSVLPLCFAAFYYFVLQPGKTETGEGSTSIIIPLALVAAAAMDILMGIFFLLFAAGRKEDGTSEFEKIGPWKIKK
ncbi:MAG: hypothetical protein KAS23_05570 [Anaerohalosphaera sp.]|nr:hypothetical protein [Anaerohalosphaera sp.]